MAATPRSWHHPDLLHPLIPHLTLSLLPCVSRFVISFEVMFQQVGVVDLGLALYLHLLVHLVHEFFDYIIKVLSTADRVSMLCSVDSNSSNTVRISVQLS